MGKIVAKRGSTFYFHCNLTIESSKDILESLRCGYNNTNTNELVTLASQTPSSQFQKAPSLPTSYMGRVKAYPSNYTFAVEYLKFSDHRQYYCHLSIKSKIFRNDPKYYPLEIPFGPAQLEVEGKINAKLF